MKPHLLAERALHRRADYRSFNMYPAMTTAGELIASSNYFSAGIFQYCRGWEITHIIKRLFFPIAII
jgi:hypothetical protein